MGGLIHWVALGRRRSQGGPGLRKRAGASQSWRLGWQAVQDEWGPREWAMEGDRVLGNGREAVDGGPHDCASRVVWGQDGDCPRLDLRDHMKDVADCRDSEPVDGREESRLGR